MANAPLVARRIENGRAHYRFAETLPISSYLFSFVAGKFDVLSDSRDGRVLNLYHRETDNAKVASNAPAIFEFHHRAIDWLEDYTGIVYPFQKFDFVLVPSFQYRDASSITARLAPARRGAPHLWALADADYLAGVITRRPPRQAPYV